MYVCTCVRVCVGTCVCVYMCTCVRWYVCMCVRVYVGTNVQNDTRIAAPEAQQKERLDNSGYKRALGIAHSCAGSSAKGTIGQFRGTKGLWELR